MSAPVSILILSIFGLFFLFWAAALLESMTRAKTSDMAIGLGLFAFAVGATSVSFISFAAYLAASTNLMLTF